METAQVPRQPVPWLRPELIGSWREICLVILVMLGHSAWASGWAYSHGSSGNYLTSILSDSKLIKTITVEGTLLAFFLWLLHRRGWKREDLRIRITWGSTFQAFLLMGAMMMVHAVAMIALLGLVYALGNSHSLLTTMQENGLQTQFHAFSVGWTSIFVALFLNAYFEELTCTAYIFTQFAAKKGPLFALVLTVALRMSCHTYQGVLSCLGIGAVFLVSGLWYWRTRNLWILILSHAILDIFSIGLVKFIGGHLPAS